MIYKIWCDGKEAIDKTLRKLENYGYLWNGSCRLPTSVIDVYTVMGLHINTKTKRIRRSVVRARFDEWACEEIELNKLPKSVKPETIVIYRSGLDVIALDKNTGKKAVARCNPADTFDFQTGAKLAFDRLMCAEATESLRPTYFTGRVVCVKCPQALGLTVGKIYEFVNGLALADSGNKVTASPINDVDDLNSRFSNNTVKFLKVVE